MDNTIGLTESDCRKVTDSLYSVRTTAPDACLSEMIWEGSLRVLTRNPVDQSILNIKRYLRDRSIPLSSIECPQHRVLPRIPPFHIIEVLGYLYFRITNDFSEVFPEMVLEGPTDFPLEFLRTDNPYLILCDHLTYTLLV